MQAQSESLSFSKKFEYFIDKARILSFPVLGILIGFVFIVAPIVAAIYTTWFPSWVASPISIFGWCFAGFVCWHWESWKASGPRGLFINPAGDVGDIRVTFAWIFFGLFLMVMNIALQREWVYLNEHGRITLKKNQEA